MRKKMQNQNDLSSDLLGLYAKPIVSIDEVANQPNMTRLELKGGYVLYPLDWIVVNQKEAMECTYAGVIECRLASYNMPHLLFFLRKKMSALTKDDYEEINRKATEAYPTFKELLEQQVTPIDDPDQPGHMLNEDEWMQSPQLGYFPIYIWGTSTASPYYFLPLPAMVVHTDSTTEKEE